jgi:hypothetical protein
MTGNVGIYLTEGMFLFYLNDLRLDDSSIPTYSVSTPGFISLEGRDSVVIHCTDVPNEDSLGDCNNKPTNAQLIKLNRLRLTRHNGRSPMLHACGEVCDQVDFEKHVIANQHDHRKV